MDLQEAKTHAHATIQLTEELAGHVMQSDGFTERLHTVVQSSASAAAMQAEEELLAALATAREKATELVNALNAVSD